MQHKHLLSVEPTAFYWAVIDNLYANYEVGAREIQKFLSKRIEQEGDLSNAEILFGSAAPYDGLRAMDAAHKYTSALFKSEATAEALANWAVTTLASDRATATYTLSRALWFDNGLPTIQLGHKLASNLMMTNIPEELFEEVRLPYSSVQIDVPDGLLVGIGINGQPAEARFMQVGAIHNSTGDRQHVLHIGLEDGGIIYKEIPKLSELLANKEAGSYPVADNRGMELTDTDERCVAMAVRLLAGICLYMSGDPATNTVKYTGASHNKWTGSQRKSPLPTRRVFTLTKEVKINLKEEVQKYARGETTWKAMTQIIVRGHWKSQAHGSGRSLRKHIYIEPYWRGPDDAPIAIRPHKLG